MALITNFNNIEASNNTFSDWLNKTNEMISLFRGDDLQTGGVVTANASGGITTGNVRLEGEIVANTLIAFDELRGGDLFDGNSATLSIVSNTTFTSAANLVLIEKYLQVDTDSLFVGNIEAQSTVQFTGNDSILEFKGANQEFIWSATNTYASIVTNEDGSLEFNADVYANSGNASSIELKVDSITVASFFEGGDISFYNAAGNTQLLFWDASGEVLGINTASPDANVSLDVSGNTHTTDLVVSNQITSDIVVVDSELRGNTTLAVTTNAQFTGANVVIDNDLYVDTNLYATAINNVQMIGNTASITSSTPATIDSFPLTQSKGFKYVIQGDNNDANSAYIVEIVGTHNGLKLPLNDTDVFFTRYGEMNNAFTANVTPKVVGSNLILEAVCSSATLSNTHNFTMIRFETR